MPFIEETTSEQNAPFRPAFQVGRASSFAVIPGLLRKFVRGDIVDQWEAAWRKLGARSDYAEDPDAYWGPIPTTIESLHSKCLLAQQPLVTPRRSGRQRKPPASPHHWDQTIWAALELAARLGHPTWSLKTELGVYFAKYARSSVQPKIAKGSTSLAGFIELEAKIGIPGYVTRWLVPALRAERVDRNSLGYRLQRWRIKAGYSKPKPVIDWLSKKCPELVSLTNKDSAYKQIGHSLWLWENNVTTPTESELAALLELYGVRDAIVELPQRRRVRFFRQTATFTPALHDELNLCIEFRCAPLGLLRKKGFHRNVPPRTSRSAPLWVRGGFNAFVSYLQAPPNSDPAIGGEGQNPNCCSVGMVPMVATKVLRRIMARGGRKSRGPSAAKWFHFCEWMLSPNGGVLNQLASNLLRKPGVANAIRSAKRKEGRDAEPDYAYFIKLCGRALEDLRREYQSHLGRPKLEGDKFANVRKILLQDRPLDHFTRLLQAAIVDADPMNPVASKRWATKLRRLVMLALFVIKPNLQILSALKASDFTQMKSFWRMKFPGLPGRRFTECELDIDRNYTDLLGVFFGRVRLALLDKSGAKCDSLFPTIGGRGMTPQAMSREFHLATISVFGQPITIREFEEIILRHYLKLMRQPRSCADANQDGADPQPTVTNIAKLFGTEACNIQRRMRQSEQLHALATRNGLRKRACPRNPGPVPDGTR